MDAHGREAAGAAAGMGDVYGRRWTAGDRVRFARPLYGGDAVGVVVDVTARHVVVQAEDGVLFFRADELRANDSGNGL